MKMLSALFISEWMENSPITHTVTAGEYNESTFPLWIRTADTQATSHSMHPTVPGDAGEWNSTK